ncbi:hypothetical protein BN871_CZ_00420 [Paenibacillus sp. P22]|nr:hypothetical protein BN871_CZ_00420 [Paenibacillus sp. P22]
MGSPRRAVRQRSEFGFTPQGRPAAKRIWVHPAGPSGLRSETGLGFQASGLRIHAFLFGRPKPAAEQDSGCAEQKDDNSEPAEDFPRAGQLDQESAEQRSGDHDRAEDHALDAEHPAGHARRRLLLKAIIEGDDEHAVAGSEEQAEQKDRQRSGAGRQETESPDRRADHRVPSAQTQAVAQAAPDLVQESDSSNRASSSSRNQPAEHVFLVGRKHEEQACELEIDDLDRQRAEQAEQHRIAQQPVPEDEAPAFFPHLAERQRLAAFRRIAAIAGRAADGRSFPVNGIDLDEQKHGIREKPHADIESDAPCGGKDRQGQSAQQGAGDFGALVHEAVQRGCLQQLILPHEAAGQGLLGRHIERGNGGTQREHRQQPEHVRNEQQGGGQRSGKQIAPSHQLQLVEPVCGHSRHGSQQEISIPASWAMSRLPPLSPALSRHALVSRNILS